MLKRISFIIGMPFTGILIIIMALAMAIATFVESGQGTNTAWALIYDAWWFELIFLLILVNLVGSIIKNKLYKRQKITVFVFHLAFALIIVGGGITRYTSEEGMMHIREGKMSGTIVSNKTFMDIEVSGNDISVAESKAIRLSPLTPNKFKWKGNVNGSKIRIRSRAYIQNAAIQHIASPGGDPYVQLVMLAGGQVTASLRNGKVVSYPGITLSLNNNEEQTDLSIQSEGTELWALSPHQVVISSMGASETEQYAPGDTVPLVQGKLLSVNGVRLALQRFIPSAKLQYVQSGSTARGSGMDVTRLEVDLEGMKSEIFVMGRSNMVGEPATINMGGLSITASYGSRQIQLPFVLRLQDFRIDRYPGSNSPSSFESDVVLIDVENDINEVHNIYMNNVLKHRGYRFYQSSYDQDEMGTILSVKRDRLGTSITYSGYFFMILGMIVALFDRGTRFSRLSRSTAVRSAKATTIIVLLIIFGATSNAQDLPSPSKEISSEFGKLWVQGKEGRFKPVNTLSNEVMRKVVKKSSFEGKNADEVLLGMIAYPDEWKQARIFEVDHAELHRMLGFKGEFVSFNDFISEGRYILSELVNQAYTKRVQERTDLDKEVMKLDEKINVFYMVQTGALLKIFPDPESEDGTWKSVSDLMGSDMTVTDTLGQVFLLYTRAIREGDTEMASEIVTFLQQYQDTNSTYPLLEGRKKAEILYNRINLFDRLIRFYGIFGFTLLLLQFLRIFRPAKWVEHAFKIGVIHLVVAFGIHTIFLGLRWYIGGHAPLSNGYESMIFVAWITLLAGIIFTRRTGFAIALTTILAMFSLLVAHMSWMNPDITNLVPVLKSPWLTIHVTVIMAGYGFLGMSMLMGLVNLVFYAISNSRNRKKLIGVLDQVSKVNHLSVIIGLYFLTIGTFLGGVWANESWGRYWGWDPKETWALISVFVYTFITHMHRFPGMRGTYAFSLATMLGYLSILMTYFGVNYFLGGIHSYAGGVAFNIPFWVYLVAIFLVLLSVIAFNKQKVLSSDYLEEE